MTVLILGAEKGGVGKTSLALNLAVMATNAGIDTVLLDADRQQSATKWLNNRINFPELRPISILANCADPLREISSLANRYQLVICDIGAQNYKALIECALLADMYLLPTGTSDMDLQPAEDLLQLLGKLRPIQADRPIDIRCVLSKAPGHPTSAENKNAKERLQSQGHSVMNSIITQRSSWRSMANSGRALQELKGKSKDEKAVAEMSALYAEVVQILTQHNGG